ncbi:D-alanyl-D-alanine carboxypeptidase [Vulcanimicrobium alpinum]|uniref:D-alanyl-D-alanine carboxypeptidase n=1 Tax=Vulcanimicrobium alpinum TaxID=3016050 RepID=A0AAN1Y0C1_UNVUL|nr:D-alanyl-D-alanine carboxypeptidase/D-alanyl-D-alanine-endopeptidase [Vulcanimicrobium alpinum]BDE07642.1 D-alanyl-D-alanine carboxypeptidase [Vulcanimicrobium alpinum]
MTPARALFIAGALIACAAPALAADRSAGANVPKPSSSGAPWSDGQISAVHTNVDLALARAASLQRAHIGMYAIDAHDGRVIYERNQDEAFQPASTFKLVVGNAALDKLGPAFHFTTQAYVSDPVVDGALQGPLHLRGNGDVLLDDRVLASLPDALRTAGIASVRGVVPDPEPFPAYLPGWSWDDFPWYYAAPVTALGFNDNAIGVTIAPGATVGAPAVVSVTPWGSACVAPGPCASEQGFTIWNDATTSAAGGARTVDAELRRGEPLGNVHLIGAIPLGSTSENFSLAAPEPQRYAAAAAARALRAGGITVNAAPVAPAAVQASAPIAAIAAPQRVVWSHDSEPLSDLLFDLWLPSDNILAEELLRSVAATADKPYPGTAAGIAAEQGWLRGLGANLATITIEDGSGLSTYDRIAPRDLVTILKHEWDSPQRDVVLDDLPIAGSRGTLKSEYTDPAIVGRVFAKSGSVSHVRCLAGYIATRTHGTVIFALQIDDWVGEFAELQRARERVLAEIAAL